MAVKRGNDTRRSYRVEAVARACEILGAFTSASDVLELKAITARSHLNKVTVFRILGTLVEMGFVERVEPEATVHGFNRSWRSATASAMHRKVRSCHSLLW